MSMKDRAREQASKQKREGERRETERINFGYEHYTCLKWYKLIKQVLYGHL